MFEYGQAYVALSRATCLSGLILKTFDAKAIRTRPDVKEFYRCLGYTCETEHEDTATISTSLYALGSIYSCYLESLGDDNVVYAKAPPQTSAWILSKQERVDNKKKENIQSHHDTSDSEQFNPSHKCLEKKVDNSKLLTQFKYVNDDNLDPFMEKCGMLNKSIKSGQTQEQHSNDEVNSLNSRTRFTEVSEEQRLYVVFAFTNNACACVILLTFNFCRKIQANKLAAQKRINANRSEKS